MGFDRVIDYRQEDFTQTGPYVTVGGRTTRLLQTLLSRPLFSKLASKNMRIVALKPNKGLAYINDLFEAGKLKWAIDGPYPLSEVPRVIQYFGEAKHKGKVVIAVARRDGRETIGATPTAPAA